MPQVPLTYYASVAVRGPWWTDHEPSLRVPRAFGAPVSVWTAGDGPNVLLVPSDVGSHERWSPIVAQLGDRCTLHAMDRTATSLADDVDQVLTAANAVGAEYIAGFTDDLVVLRGAGRRAECVRRVLVLTVPGEVLVEEQLDVEFMRCVAIGNRNLAAVTEDDVRLLIKTMFEEEQGS